MAAEMDMVNVLDVSFLLRRLTVSGSESYVRLFCLVACLFL
jgi:hypothetical protein